MSFSLTSLSLLVWWWWWWRFFLDHPSSLVQTVVSPHHISLRVPHLFLCIVKMFIKTLLRRPQTSLKEHQFQLELLVLLLQEFNLGLEGVDFILLCIHLVPEVNLTLVNQIDKPQDPKNDVLQHLQWHDTKENGFLSRIVSNNEILSQSDHNSTPSGWVSQTAGDVDKQKDNVVLHSDVFPTSEAGEINRNSKGLSGWSKAAALHQIWSQIGHVLIEVIACMHPLTCACSFWSTWGWHIVWPNAKEFYCINRAAKKSPLLLPGGVRPLKKIG